MYGSQSVFQLSLTNGTSGAQMLFGIAGLLKAPPLPDFHDASLWEEAKKKGDADVKKLIDKGLIGTSVTVVLIGAETSTRRFVDYEIEQSIARGNGLLGIKISGINDKDGKTDVQGAAPVRLTSAGAPSYTWDRDKFDAWPIQD